MDGEDEIEHENGCGRLMNSIVCAICVAPILVIGSCFLLGWNERRDVCDSKAISQGKAEVVEVNCGSSGSNRGELVMFSCPLQKSGLPDLFFASTDFETAVRFQGVGLAVQSEMYQCIETAHTETTKDTSGGGGETSKTTYTYSKEWTSEPVDSTTFSSVSAAQNKKIAACGSAQNPAWPIGVPKSRVLYATGAKAGSFILDPWFIFQVPIATPLSPSTAVNGWKITGDAYINEQNMISGGAGDEIGKIKATFKTNNWNAPYVTALGENNGGTIKSWTADGSWLCSGFTLQDLREGKVSKDDLFSSMKDGSKAITWILRFAGFLLLWFGFSRVMAPLGVVADCIPCIGPMLGDFVEAVACCVSCPPACACTLGVAGIVWVAMRPAVGIPLMIVFCIVMASLVGFAVYQRSQKENGDEDVDVESS